MGNTDLVPLFDSLKTGQMVTVSFVSCMGRTDTSGVVFKVGRRSFSKKYNVTTVALNPADGSKAHPAARVKLYKRTSGVSMAHGDMGVRIVSIDVQ